MLKVGKVISRLKAFRTLLPETQGLNNAVLDVYLSVIKFTLESISFLRIHPISMTITSGEVLG